MLEEQVEKSLDLFRKIIKIAYPMNDDIPVKIGKSKNPMGVWEAYTDNTSIFININDEKAMQKQFDDIIMPLYTKKGKNFDEICQLYEVTDTPSINAKQKLEDFGKNIVTDTFLFILFHELFHPLVCPNSKRDSRKVTKALYEGIKKAEGRGADPKDIFYKVNNSRNLIWDVVVNTAFMAKARGYRNDTLESRIGSVFTSEQREVVNKVIKKYPNGILPIVYLTSATERKTDAAIDLVGMMYTTMSYNANEVREKAFEVFVDDITTKPSPLRPQTNNNRNPQPIQAQEAIDDIKQMYYSMISEVDPRDLKHLGIDRSQYRTAVDYLFDFKNPHYENARSYVLDMTTRLFMNLETRYDAIKGLIQPISKYIQLDQKSGSFDSQTQAPNQSGSGGGRGGEESDADGEGDEGDGGGSGDDGEDEEGSVKSTLDELEEEMGGLSDEDDEDGAGGAGDKEEDEGDDDGKGGKDSKDQKELDDLLKALGEDDGMGKHGGGSRKAGKGGGNGLKYTARDDFYKKNADAIDVRSPQQDTQSIDIGDRYDWKLKSTQIISGEDLALMDINKLMDFQQATGLPVLIKLSENQYKLNGFELKKTTLKSFTMNKHGIDIPDNWVMFTDSSSSMTFGRNFVGSGDSYDLLCRVIYGVKKGLYKVCKEMNKDFKIGAVNFSSSTYYSGMSSFMKSYNAAMSPYKKTVLSPQSGGTTLDTTVFKHIKRDLKPGKTVYTMITDGVISNETRVYNKIKETANDPNACFMLIEISHNSHLGRQVKALEKTHSNVKYHSVRTVKDIKNKLESILIEYE